MHIGLIGLGKMGFNMRERLRKGGVEVTGYDRNPDVTDAGSIDELLAAVPTPRLIWVMVPAGDITDAVIKELGEKLSEGDLAQAEEGWLHCGPVGAGHFVKMVHNGIEYGLMQAYAEGYELLDAKDIVKDVHGCFKAWTRGTVVRSWLLDLLVKALDEDPGLQNIDDYVEDSGEGRWTVEEAIANAIPAPAITAALFARFESREDSSPAMKMVSALRHQFGGHATRPAK